MSYFILVTIFYILTWSPEHCWLYRSLLFFFFPDVWMSLMSLASHLVLVLSKWFYFSILLNIVPRSMCLNLPWDLNFASYLSKGSCGMPLVPTLQRQRRRQADFYEFEASLVYIETSNQPKLHSETLCQKENLKRGV